jgi:hypothetical protein
VLALLVWMGAMFAWRALYVWTFTQSVRAVPTMGPVQDGSGLLNGPGGSLTTNTNCVDVGQPLIITVTLVNRGPAPLHMEGTPRPIS